MRFLYKSDLRNNAVEPENEKYHCESGMQLFQLGAPEITSTIPLIFFIN